jgi:hypothetical protein
MQGRFISPDDLFVDQYVEDPQSWNLYAYSVNNPLLYTDPTGMWKEIKPGFWQWEEGDTWEILAKILNVEVSGLTKAFPNVKLGPDTILQPGDLNAGPNAQVTDRHPSGSEITLVILRTDEDYMNAWLARFGRDDGMVPDPTQMPISRWIFGIRMVNYTELAVEDYARGFIRFEPGVPGSGAIGMTKKADIQFVKWIIKKIGLSKEQKRILHDTITGQNLTKEEITKIAQEIKKHFPNK